MIASANALSGSPSTISSSAAMLSPRSSCINGAPGAKSGVEIKREVEHLEVDDDGRSCVLGEVPISGDHHDDRLTDVVHVAACQRARRLGTQARVRDEQGQAPLS